MSTVTITLSVNLALSYADLIRHITYADWTMLSVEAHVGYNDALTSTTGLIRCAIRQPSGPQITSTLHAVLGFSIKVPDEDVLPTIVTIDRMVCGVDRNRIPPGSISHRLLHHCSCTGHWRMPPTALELDDHIGLADALTDFHELCSGVATRNVILGASS